MIHCVILCKGTEIWLLYNSKNRWIGKYVGWIRQSSRRKRYF